MADQHEHTVLKADAYSYAVHVTVGPEAVTIDEVDYPITDDVVLDVDSVRFAPDVEAGCLRRVRSPEDAPLSCPCRILTNELEYVVENGDELTVRYATEWPVVTTDTDAWMTGEV